MTKANFKSFKGRSITIGEQVIVYRNLRNGKWSIKSVESKLVLGHADEVVIIDAEYYVNESGRQRVLATKEKNVHAGVTGEFVDPSLYGEVNRSVMEEVTYNPYKYESFVRVADESKIENHKMVYLDNEHKVYGCTY